jgi:hypothetical protein
MYGHQSLDALASVSMEQRNPSDGIQQSYCKLCSWTEHSSVKMTSLKLSSLAIHASANLTRFSLLTFQGIYVTWGAVKKVIRKYQQGKIGCEHLDTVHLPSFKTITDSDINHVCRIWPYLGAVAVNPAASITFRTVDLLARVPF